MKSIEFERLSSDGLVEDEWGICMINEVVRKQLSPTPVPEGVCMTCRRLLEMPPHGIAVRSSRSALLARCRVHNSHLGADVDAEAVS